MKDQLDVAFEKAKKQSIDYDGLSFVILQLRTDFYGYFVERSDTLTSVQVEELFNYIMLPAYEVIATFRNGVRLA
jgi:hypothetical protein